MWKRNESIARAMCKLGVAMLGWALAAAVHAQAIGCALSNDDSYGGPGHYFAPSASLNGISLTIGRDVPNGTIVYRQSMNARAPIRVSCPATATSWTLQRIVGTSRPLTSWNTGPYAGKVYGTSLSGIGVAFTYGGQVYPFDETRTGTGNRVEVLPADSLGDLVLIKIGPVSPGALSLAVRYVLRAKTGSVENELILGSVTGSMQIAATTCTTPNVTVRLGDHQANAFPNLGSSSGWRGFNIELQNCPAFHGASLTRTLTDNSPTGFPETINMVQTSRQLNANNLRFTLTATTGTLPLYPGTVTLSPTTSGPAAASGIGVQIGDNNGTPVRLGTLMPTNITPRTTVGNYTIPLRARYIRIPGTLAPGPANASVEFTINYQ